MPGNELDWNFKILITLEELERTGVCGKLREGQHACHAAGWKVPSFVIDFIEIAVRVGNVCKEKAVLEWGRALMIGELRKMRTKLGKAKLAVQVSDVREMALKVQEDHLRDVVQDKLEVMFYVNNATKAH